MLGPNPSGYLIVTGEGRMMAILTRADRAPPKEDADGSALFKTMMASLATLGSKAMTSPSTNVDLSLAPRLEWHRADPVFKQEGDTFSIRPLSSQSHACGPDGAGHSYVDKSLIWRR